MKKTGQGFKPRQPSAGVSDTDKGLAEQNCEARSVAGIRDEEIAVGNVIEPVLHLEILHDSVEIQGFFVCLKVLPCSRPAYGPSEDFFLPGHIENCLSFRLRRVQI